MNKRNKNKISESREFKIWFAEGGWSIFEKSIQICLQAVRTESELGR